MIRIATLAGAVALAVGALAAAGTASAAVSVFGSGYAEQCFHAARDGGDLYAGIADCDRALVEDQLQGRDLAGTYVNRGVLHMAVNDLAFAQVDFEKSIAIDPSLGEAWVNLGALKIAQRQFTDGIADIDRGLTLGSQEPEKAYYNRGLADEGLDNEQAAYFDYTKAAQLKPTWDAPKTELTRFTIRPAS